MTAGQSLPKVIGTNYRNIRTRHGVTQETLASHARLLGLRWPTGKVGDFEAGRSESPLSTVLTALLALDNAVPVPVTLAELMASDGRVSLTPDFQPPGSAVTAVSSGHPWDVQNVEPEPSDVFDIKDLRRRSDLVEARVARRLGIDRDTLIRLSWQLWPGRTFGEERDHSWPTLSFPASRLPYASCTASLTSANDNAISAARETQGQGRTVIP
jgi:DNA-binding XRE family transcriptional regulator